MAPEMLMEEKELYGPPLDIYSFGVMLYEMVLGEHPFLKLGGKSNCTKQTNQTKNKQTNKQNKQTQKKHNKQTN